jgi:hypothetical protein
VSGSQRRLAQAKDILRLVARPESSTTYPLLFEECAQFNDYTGASVPGGTPFQLAERIFDGADDPQSLADLLEAIKEIIYKSSQEAGELKPTFVETALYGPKGENEPLTHSLAFNRAICHRNSEATCYARSWLSRHGGIRPLAVRYADV